MRKLLHIIIYISVLLFAVPASAMTEDGQFVVVLDAGHGGKDPGCIGSKSSNREKDIAYNITMEVGRLLKNNHPEKMGMAQGQIQISGFASSSSGQNLFRYNYENAMLGFAEMVCVDHLSFNFANRLGFKN